MRLTSHVRFWSRAAGAVTMAGIVVPDDLDPAWVAFTGAQARQTHVHTAAMHSAHPFHAPIGAAILYVPIRLGDEGLGLLGLIRQESDFTPQEIGELEQLADALALILHNAQLLADLREDIRRRELLERQLEVNEQRFASVIDSSMDAIITVNSRRQILIFNPAAEQMLRLPRVQALGQPLDRFIPARLRSSHRHLIEAFAASAPTALALGRTLAITGLRADGEEFPAEASLSHIRVGEDQLYTVVLRDITARERIEREKKLVEDQLRQSQKLEAIGQLAGGIAHDFNNLLTAILGNASLLQDSRHPPAEQQEMLRQIAQAGNRAATLTSQLLLFSRRQEAVRQNFDLNHVVAEMLKMLRRILGEQIELSVAFAAQPQLIHADSGMLDQVLLNLSVNARDAMPDGGKLHICTEAISLRLDEATGRLKAWQGGQWLPDSGRPFQESPIPQTASASSDPQTGSCC